ncbi:hypothetical protein FRC11_003256, partial [Ceratobasidium sp. 423]
RNGRLHDSGWEQHGRSSAREHNITHGRMDHYSPPPDSDDSPPRRGSRNRSVMLPDYAALRREFPDRRWDASTNAPPTFHGSV